jgi:hypothetical protein
VVGALKLHFPKQNPLGERASGYVSAILGAHLQVSEDQPVEPALCMVVDVSSGQVFNGPTATRQRLRQVDEGCVEIAGRWASIQP